MRLISSMPLLIVLPNINFSRRDNQNDIRALSTRVLSPATTFCTFTSSKTFPILSMVLIIFIKLLLTIVSLSDPTRSHLQTLLKNIIDYSWNQIFSLSVFVRLGGSPAGPHPCSVAGAVRDRLLPRGRWQQHVDPPAGGLAGPVCHHDLHQHSRRLRSHAALAVGARTHHLCGWVDQGLLWGGSTRPLLIYQWPNNQPQLSLTPASRVGWFKSNEFKLW